MIFIARVFMSEQRTRAMSDYQLGRRRSYTNRWRSAISTPVTQGLLFSHHIASGKNCLIVEKVKCKSHSRNTLLCWIASFYLPQTSRAAGPNCVSEGIPHLELSNQHAETNIRLHRSMFTSAATHGSAMLTNLRPPPSFLVHTSPPQAVTPPNSRSEGEAVRDCSRDRLNLFVSLLHFFQHTTHHSGCDFPVVKGSMGRETVWAYRPLLPGAKIKPICHMLVLFW